MPPDHRSGRHKNEDPTSSSTVSSDPDPNEKKNQGQIIPIFFLIGFIDASTKIRAKNRRTRGPMA
jgi:hypothetical protein